MNNCNFTVLMRNLDSRVNTKITRLLDVEKAAAFAMNKIYSNNYYPYLFIDSTPRGQITNCRCYINVFGSIKITFNQRGMKSYIISERDFLENFYEIDTNTAARKNGNNEKIKLPLARIQKESEGAASRADISNRIDKRRRDRRRQRLARSLQQY